MTKFCNLHIHNYLPLSEKFNHKKSPLSAIKIKKNFAV